MTARGWGVFLDIRTSRQNAYLFMYERFEAKKGSKTVKNQPKKKFFVFETRGCLIDS